MKKTILMAAVLGAMGFANVASAAGVASHVFTWSGTVPAVSTQNGFIIKASDTSDIKNGTLNFSVDAAGKGVLMSASSLDFKVFEWDEATSTVGAPATQYTFEMTNLGATKDGLVQEQDPKGYYKITADGADLAKATPVIKATGEQTVLTVAPSAEATPSNQPGSHDDVVVQATIVVTAAS